jgi:hypothetical protein
METELPYPVCLFRLWICPICEDTQLSFSNHNKVALDAGTFFHNEGEVPFEGRFHSFSTKMKGIKRSFIFYAARIQESDLVPTLTLYRIRKVSS